MNMTRTITEIDCPLSRTPSCHVAAMRSGPAEPNVRLDWYECDHGHTILIMRHEWSA